MENKTVNVLGEKYSIMFVDEYPERFSDFEESADGLRTRKWLTGLQYNRQKYLKYSENLKFCRWFYA